MNHCWKMCNFQQEPKGPVIDFLTAVNPVDVTEWRESRWILKPYLVLKVLCSQIQYVTYIYIEYVGI